jgi:bacterioferritin (cytochrome b1)
MQGFQRGESSEGGYLYGCAKKFAAETGDAAYVDATQLFIREEQRHARDLARILTMAGIPLLKKTSLDSVFRQLRRLGGLDISISVLITAEIIAKVYYKALREATDNPALRRLCDQILYDEQAHVEFQAERLAILRRGRGRWATRLTHAGHAVFMLGTCVMVQLGHGRAMKSGGYGMRRFFASCWRETRDAC